MYPRSFIGRDYLQTKSTEGQLITCPSAQEQTALLRTLWYSVFLNTSSTVTKLILMWSLLLVCLFSVSR
jgi:hypothetical protein